MDRTTGCGKSVCYGHGDYAVCGQPYYSDPIWICDGCRIKALEAHVRALEKDALEMAAKVAESVPLMTYATPGHMAQRDEHRKTIAAAIRALKEKAGP